MHEILIKHFKVQCPDLFFFASSYPAVKQYIKNLYQHFCAMIFLLSLTV